MEGRGRKGKGRKGKGREGKGRGYVGIIVSVASTDKFTVRAEVQEFQCYHI